MNVAGTHAPRKRYPQRDRLRQGRSLVPHKVTPLGKRCVPWFDMGWGWFGPYCEYVVRTNAWHWHDFRHVPKVAFPALPDPVPPGPAIPLRPPEPVKGRLKRRWAYGIEVSHAGGGRRQVWLCAPSPGNACAKVRRDLPKDGWGRPSDLVVLGVNRAREPDYWADERFPLDSDPNGPPGWLVRKHDNRG